MLHVLASAILRQINFGWVQAERKKRKQSWSIMCVLTCVLPTFSTLTFIANITHLTLRWLSLLLFTFVHSWIHCRLARTFRHSVRQELLSDCLSKTMKSVGEGTKTRVNINIFLSQDVPEDGLSDTEGAEPPVSLSKFISCSSRINLVWKRKSFPMCDDKKHRRKFLIFSRASFNFAGKVCSTDGGEFWFNLPYWGV